MPDIAIELRSVTKRFPNPAGGEVFAVNHISLEVRDGEFFSLLGPSGCGKTTTLRMIAGFELPSEGEIYIHGREMGQVPPFLRPVNTVFQQYALFPHMSVGQNVGFGLEMKGVEKSEIRKRVAETLAMVRLPGMESRRAKQLSGGQQQRVALARALVNKPEVLLLDEPLGALDLKLRKEMQLELKNLQREVGITFIYVTHDQEEALTMSDRIAVMNKGLVHQMGPPDEIYERPVNKFVADFIGESNFVDGTIKSHEDTQWSIQLAGGEIFSMVSDGALPVGRMVTLALRPEKLRINDEAAGDNVLHGVVEEIIYIGTDTHYGVRLAGGQKLRVREQNVVPGKRYLAKTGEQVSVSFTSYCPRVLVE